MKSKQAHREDVTTPCQRESQQGRDRRYSRDGCLGPDGPRKYHARAQPHSSPTSCAWKLYSSEYCSFPRPICSGPSSRSSISGWTCSREQHNPQGGVSNSQVCPHAWMGPPALFPAHGDLSPWGLSAYVPAVCPGTMHCADQDAPKMRFKGAIPPGNPIYNQSHCSGDQGERRAVQGKPPC